MNAKQWIFISLCFFIILPYGYSNGTETFTNFPGGTSYSSGNYQGDNQIVWYYVEAKGGQKTTQNQNDAICLNKNADAALYSQTIAGGCNRLSFQFEQEYSTDVNAEVFINGEKIGTLTSDNEQDQTKFFSVGNLEIEGGFVIEIRQVSGSSGHLTIDDISWTGYYVSPYDTDSQLSGGENTEPPHISSLIDTKEEKILVLDMNFSDPGTSDNRPTLINNIVFTPAQNNTVENWDEVLAGAFLSGADLAEDKQGEILPSQIKFSGNAFVSVANGESQTCRLYLFLQKQLPQNIDNQILAIELSCQNIQTDTAGSVFGSGSVANPNLSIQVEASTLAFSDLPETVRLNQPFSTTVAATDENGNTDKDISAQISLSLKSGEGMLYSQAGLQQSITNGTFLWQDLVYNRMDTFSLQLNSPNEPFDEVVSQKIAVLGDNDTEIIAPVEQIEGKTIASTADTRGEAVEVFRFSVSDKASGDEKPSHISAINIKNTYPPNSADWTNTIEDVFLRIDGEEIITGEPLINDSYIKIPIKNGELEIPDGEQRQVALWFYVSPDKIEDHAQWQCKIDAGNHYCESFPFGSTLSPDFPADIVSGIFTIQTLATHLYIEAPEFAGLHTDFEVKVIAGDENGNTDLDADHEVTLSGELGSGNLSAQNSLMQQLGGGEAVWNTLRYDKAESLTILASADGLASALSDKITIADNDSQLEIPEKQPDGGLVSALANTKNEAIPVFSFIITDKATTDGLPTKIETLVIKNAQPQNNAKWSVQIGGIKLTVDNREITIHDIQISDNEIEIETDSLFVENGQSKECTVWFYLHNENITDGAQYQFMIDADDHDWKTGENSSLLAENFDFDIVSNVFITNVSAVEFAFKAIPVFVEKEKEFQLLVAVTDENGNIDKDIKQTIKLSLAGGDGQLSSQSGLSAILKNGQYSFTDLSYSGNEPFQLKIENGGGDISLVSPEIWVTDNINEYLNENFETGDISTWIQTDDWKISQYKPVNGSKSLKHNLSGVDGQSQIWYEINENEPNKGIMHWSFRIKNSDWSPSGDNHFGVFLFADTNQSLDSINGYAVGVKLDGTTDNPALWRISKGETVEKIIETDFLWQENQTVSIQITRFGDGTWTMNYEPYSISQKRSSLIESKEPVENSHSPLGKRQSKEAVENSHSPLGVRGSLSLSGFDNTFLSAKYFGLYFSYTSSRAGKLWFDDIEITGINTAPFVISISAQTANRLSIIFSEPLDKPGASETDNYELKNENGEIIPVENILFDDNYPERVLLITGELENGNYQLLIDGVKDADQLAVSQRTESFEIRLPLSFGSVVINEIMADPSPPVELPETEYIEIYNTTSSEIYTQNWKLVAGTTEYFFPDTNDTGEKITIPPDSYAILCRQEDSELFNDYGQTIGLERFPALVNAGQSILLFDNQNNIISKVSYTGHWYQDEFKQEGGWSLEQISPENPCGQSNNWRASNHTDGGTPGKQNSVVGENPDLVAPEIHHIAVPDDSTLIVYFSEIVTPESIQNPFVYEVNNNTGNPMSAEAIDKYGKTVKLTFADKFSAQSIYTLYIYDEISDCAGNIMAASANANFALPMQAEYQDIVINEILFNPYQGGEDFVEIYNRSEKIIDLSTLKLCTRDEETGDYKSVCPVSQSGILMFPKEYFILTPDYKAVEQFYYIEKPENAIEMTDFPTFSNDKGRAILIDKHQIIIDDFFYSEDMHFGLISDNEGVSLERIHFDKPTNEADTWHSAAQTAGYATPTYKNSQFAEPNDNQNDEFSIQPEVFSPDNDGIDDVLHINYRLDEAGYVANISIFDAKGRKIHRLANNKLLAKEGELIWDGISDAGERTRIGIYIIYIETFNLEGKVKKYKKTCVLARKWK